MQFRMEISDFAVGLESLVKIFRPISFVTQEVIPFPRIALDIRQYVFECYNLIFLIFRNCVMTDFLRYAARQ